MRSSIAYLPHIKLCFSAHAQENTCCIVFRTYGLGFTGPLLDVLRTQVITGVEEWKSERQTELPTSTLWPSLSMHSR
eukprot:4576232-Amphidinium_carterae.1